MKTFIKNSGMRTKTLAYIQKIQKKLNDQYHAFLIMIEITEFFVHQKISAFLKLQQKRWVSKSSRTINFTILSSSVTNKKIVQQL
jgi:hypothetical protein